MSQLQQVGCKPVLGALNVNLRLTQSWTLWSGMQCDHTAVYKIGHTDIYPALRESEVLPGAEAVTQNLEAHLESVFALPASFDRSGKF
jgi:hypothetical protein